MHRITSHGVGAKAVEKKRKKMHVGAPVSHSVVCVNQTDLQSVHVYGYMHGERDIKQFVRQSVSDDESKEFYSSSGGAAFQRGGGSLAVRTEQALWAIHQ